jgi:hypothetical protein
MSISMSFESGKVIHSTCLGLYNRKQCMLHGILFLAGVRFVLELGAYGRGEPCDEAYGLELFCCATGEGDLEAWEWVQRCFGEIVLAWLRHQPSRAEACRLEGEANYVALAFERFWQASALTQHVPFRTLAAALQYLRTSLPAGPLFEITVTSNSSKRYTTSIFL